MEAKPFTTRHISRTKRGPSNTDTNTGQYTGVYRPTPLPDRSVRLQRGGTSKVVSFYRFSPVFFFFSITRSRVVDKRVPLNTSIQSISYGVWTLDSSSYSRTPHGNESRRPLRIYSTRSFRPTFLITADDLVDLVQRSDPTDSRESLKRRGEEGATGAPR